MCFGSMWVFFTEVQPIFNIVVVSGVQKNDLDVYIYIYTHIYSYIIYIAMDIDLEIFFSRLFHYTRYCKCRSLCYTLDPSCLPILYIVVCIYWISLMVQQVQNPPVVQETQEIQVRSLGQEDPLEDEMATHSSILA